MAVNPKKKFPEFFQKIRRLQPMGEIIAQTPEGRSKKVAALKEAIQKGTYRINTRQLANSLISHFILKKRRPP